MSMLFKGWRKHSLLALLTPSPLLPFDTEEITGSTIEVTYGALIACSNKSAFLFSYFISLEFSSDLMILLISSMSFFELNKINLFPALTAPFPLIFLLNLFIVFEVKLLINAGKFYLAREKSTFVSAFLPELINQKDPFD